MSILILTGCTVLGAVVGAWLMSHRQSRMVQHLLFERDAYKDRWKRSERRRDRALSHIPPYSRSANGALQKIGKILRGEA